MLKRLGNLIRGFFGVFVTGLEKQNPEALLEIEKENLRKQISEYNKGLAAHAGMCERLISQVQRQAKEEKELTSKAAAHLRAGNRKLAGEYALRLRNVKDEHQANIEQLEEAEKTYKELKSARDVSVKAAKAKIESLRRDIDETRIARATAELNEMAAGLINEIGGAGDTLNRLEEVVAEERENAKGRARVAKDSIDNAELIEMEAERSAMEELALAEFVAEAGIVTEESKASNFEETSPAPEDEKAT